MYPFITQKELDSSSSLSRYKVAIRDIAVGAIKSWLQKRERELVVTMNNLGRTRHIDVHATSYTNEYIRLSSFDLVVEEIEKRNVVGDVAELGVYKGDFAAVMNVAFPKRTLYLFDTFEGFHSSDKGAERKLGSYGVGRDFSDTSVEEVMKRMPNSERCVARKGFFPETAQGLENKKFCFVSIDTDLYAPVAAGLSFFHPRLSPGGFIFVHDYNNALFPGAKLAVQEFSSRNGVSYVPLTDQYGTAVIAKHVFY
jgi:O-methyltransferase